MKSYILFWTGFASTIYFTEAAITAWTNPPIAGNKDGSGAATPSITESLAGGTSTGVTIAATEGANATITYAILSQPTAGKLTLASSTGVLTLAAGKSFDFETEPKYILTITATSGASVGTATVTLSITDVNEVPVFASTQYAVTIPDGSTAGTTLTTVTATDQDTGNTVTYGLDSGSNSGSVFAIASSTGVITVASSKTTDAATYGGFKLLVTAADSASPALTATSTVWVAVTTCSSNSAALIASAVTMLVALVASLQ